jgi:N4-bis(aminopropyl)spermidine synthase
VKEIGLKDAINAVSDVVQNRPRPLREFDQIHMKSGDMVMQSEIVADWADGKRLAFIGDGDAISVCVAYLRARDVLNFGPTKITVFDFDERNVQAVKRFADHERLGHLDAVLYNCLDPFPQPGRFDCFYTNPPWGASNQGASVNVFMQRGFEAVAEGGEGLVVIADDDELMWSKLVLANVQRYASQQGFYVSRMQRKLHEYHLDDAPDLRSCNLFFSAVPGHAVAARSAAIPLGDERLLNFYGMGQSPRVKYVREKKKPDYGRASEDEYSIEWLEQR